MKNASCVHIQISHWYDQGYSKGRILNIMHRCINHSYNQDPNLASNLMFKFLCLTRVLLLVNSSFIKKSIKNFWNSNYAWFVQQLTFTMNCNILCACQHKYLMMIWKSGKNNQVWNIYQNIHQNPTSESSTMTLEYPPLFICISKTSSRVCLNRFNQ